MDAVQLGKEDIDAIIRMVQAVETVRPIDLPTCAKPPRNARNSSDSSKQAAFGRPWRDLDVPADLEEQAAREIFDRIELDGSEVVAVYRRAEHA